MPCPLGYSISEALPLGLSQHGIDTNVLRKRMVSMTTLNAEVLDLHEAIQRLDEEREREREGS